MNKERIKCEKLEEEKMKEIDGLKEKIQKLEIIK